MRVNDGEVSGIQGLMMECRDTRVNNGVSGIQGLMMECQGYKD